MEDGWKDGSRRRHSQPLLVFPSHKLFQECPKTAGQIAVKCDMSFNGPQGTFPNNIFNPPRRSLKCHYGVKISKPSKHIKYH